MENFKKFTMLKESTDTITTDGTQIGFNLPVRRSSKFLKPQVKYLLKMIDEDIQQQKKFLAHMDEWMERTKPTDKYYERQVSATHKKISFAEQCREKILNFA